MIFTGKGLVRWKHEKLANFIDIDGDGIDEFETNDERTIRRLLQLGYKEKEAASPVAQAEAQPTALTPAATEPDTGYPPDGKPGTKEQPIRKPKAQTGPRDKKKKTRGGKTK